MNDHQLAELLQHAKTIAVVGLSSNRMRASFGVAEYLQQCGYRIVPVNPNETEVLGEKSYASLLDIPDPIDIVDIFRKPEAVPEIVEQAIAKGVRCIWMQQGVEHDAAAREAQNAGVPCIMNSCILKAHHRLISARPQPVH